MNTMINHENRAGLKGLAGILCAVLGMAGCTDSEIAGSDVPATAGRGAVSITTTLSPKSAGATRSILADNGDGSITNEWEQGDSVFIIYYDTGNARHDMVAYVDRVDDATKAAEISFTMYDPNTRDFVVIGYPVGYWKDFYSGAPKISQRTGQKGTLDDINANWGILMGYRKLSFTNDVATLVGGVDMEQENCIWKLSFTDGEADITPEVETLTIRGDNGKGGYVTYRVMPDEALTAFYVAMSSNDFAAVDIYADLRDGRRLTTYSPAVNIEAGRMYTSLQTVLSPVDPDAPVDLAGKRVYEAREGDVLTGDANERTHITIADGATVTLRDARITGLSDFYSYAAAGIECMGDATIILEGENSVCPASDVWPAINVHEGKTLTIRGDGSLRAESRRGSVFCHAAAIGGGFGIKCGNIVIEGGTIEAIARGEGGAGIGAGGVSSWCGDITISGGRVTAVGADYGAGIGDGRGSGCGNVLITGGEVLATGGMGGAGIGATWGCNFGDITISGGHVVAEGGDSAPGIGYRGKGGNILISGGEVEATGQGTAAAIGGSGGTSDNHCTFDSIVITENAISIKAVKGTESPRFIGLGLEENETGPVIIDGITDAHPKSAFTHFVSEIITDGEKETWLLEHK